MIESYYWKEDLANYYRKLKPKKKPKPRTVRSQVNFEKDVILSFFMIRKLMETHKLSSKTKDYKVNLFRTPCIANVNNCNYADIDRLYDFDNEARCQKGVTFLCNQLIHSGLMFAYSGPDRNWGGVMTCSDYERGKYIYRIPLSEIRYIVKMASEDYPSQISYTYDSSKGDYIVVTD